MAVFNDFDATLDPQLQKLAQAAERFCAEMHAGRQPRWLSLLGNSGTGKTMLMQRIVKWGRRYQEPLIDSTYGDGTAYHRRVGLLKWSQCLNWMLNRDYGWVDQAKRDWLVVLDDIGSEQASIRDLSNSKLYEILEARQGKWTGITANITAEQIAERMDTRIASRLFRDNSEVIEVDCEDYNIRKFKSRKALK